MKSRIPLQIVEGRLQLAAVIECRALRVAKQFMEFVMDTGSPFSYLSDKDVRRLQISIKDRPAKENVDFGGSRFKQVSLPELKMYLLEEGKETKNYTTLNMRLSALKTTKCSEKKIQAAQMLPSILGLDFLKEQKLSLHVILTEDMAYLELEG
jgi:hypothetical protein